MFLNIADDQSISDKIIFKHKTRQIDMTNKQDIEISSYSLTMYLLTPPHLTYIDKGR